MSGQQPRAGVDRGLPAATVFTHLHGAEVHHHGARLPAARFVARWEGLLHEATLDEIAQPPIETIGYGHTGDVHAGEVWSTAKAMRVLMHDIGWASAAVAEKVEHRLTLRQRMALISFVFNLGPGVLEGKLLALINQGKMDQAADLMLDYDHAGGVEVLGLKRRRESEAWMMRHPHKVARNPHRPSHKQRKRR